MSNGAASRNVAYWTHRRSDRKPGMGFIAQIPDDYDKRYNNLILTKEGRRFYEELVHGKAKERKMASRH